MTLVAAIAVIILKFDAIEQYTALKAEHLLHQDLPPCWKSQTVIESIQIIPELALYVYYVIMTLEDILHGIRNRWILSLSYLPTGNKTRRWFCCWWCIVLCTSPCLRGFCVCLCFGMHYFMSFLVLQSS